MMTHKLPRTAGHYGKGRRPKFLLPPLRERMKKQVMTMRERVQEDETENSWACSQLEVEEGKRIARRFLPEETFSDRSKFPLQKKF